MTLTVKIIRWMQQRNLALHHPQYPVRESPNSYERKAPGPDGITKQHWAISPEITAQILALIFNYSIHLSKLPTEWKSANVVPIHKKGSQKLPSNYRPISLTCICCKLLEHIVLHELMKQINDSLSPNQHGFWHYYSCSTQLITVLL